MGHSNRQLKKYKNEHTEMECLNSTRKKCKSEYKK